MRGPSLAGACHARPSRARPEIEPIPWEGRGRGLSQVVRGPSLAGACRARPSRARPEIGPIPWEGRGRGI